MTRAAAGFALRSAIVLRQLRPIRAPVRTANDDIPDDQELLRDHREQIFLAVRLAIDRSVANRIFLLVGEVPVLDEEEVADEPWAVNRAEAVFELDVEICRIVVKVAAEGAAR